MRNINFKIIIIICLLLLNFESVSAQYSAASKKIFESISKEDDKISIMERYDQFIKNYSNKDFEEVYKQLANNFLRGSQFKNEKEFTVYKLSYYSDSQTRFISFIPKEIDEIAENNNWIIRGCLTELVNGKKTKLKSNLSVWKEKNKYLFSDILPAITSLTGKIEKCR